MSAQSHMTDASREKPPAKKRVFDRASGLILVVLFWGGLLAYRELGTTVWSMMMIEPTLAQAKAYDVADEPEKALPIVLKLLRDNPTDGGLLYFAMGLYLELDRPLLANFYLSALLNSHAGRGLSSEQSGRLMTLQLDGPIAPFRDSNFMGKQQEQINDLFYRLPKGWQVITYLHDANSVLNEPADQNVEAVGYTPPDAPIFCDGGEHACGFDFSTGNLWNAIATQKLIIDYPRGGSGCCSLSLDDPDLRSLDVAFLDFLKSREAVGKPIGNNTQESDNAILAFRSHALIKQFYVLGFLKDARDAPPESNLPYYLAFAWIVFLLLSRYAISTILESRAAKK